MANALATSQGGLLAEGRAQARADRLVYTPP
jgi:hypothetical protein